MIYPTRSAVVITAAGAPLALAFAAVEPGHWFLSLAWPLAMLILIVLDAARTAGRAAARIDFPAHAYVGETRDVALSVSIGAGPGKAWVALPVSPFVALEGDGRHRIALEEGTGAALLPLSLVRRGLARFEKLWLRWTGPFGLALRQQAIPLDASFPVLPDLRPVHELGARMVQRHSLEGLLTQLGRGEGSDFDTLVDFRTGMDRRSIDWKQSGRHMKLLAKQYRTERNNQIVFALDTGRQMCEPVAGLARIDRCVSAALLAGWIALKLGDRVAFSAFDSRPRLASGFVSGSGAFGELERMSAGIDYSSNETNYTYALTTLRARLTRRSMVILFTEFTDMVAADFLLRAIRKLVEKHLLVVLVLKDEELEAIAEAAPTDADDVTRAITAGRLLRDRQVVISELRHAGVHVVESEHDMVGERLVQSYLDLKRRDLL